MTSLSVHTEIGSDMLMANGGRGLMFLLRLTVALMLCCASAIAGGKDYSFGKYPESFARLSAQDWPQMKFILDNVLKSDDWESLVKSRNSVEALFTIRRIGDLQWKADNKKEVITYLQDLTEVLMGKKGFLVDPDGVDAKLLIREPDLRISLLEATMTSLLSIDDKAGCSHIQKVWTACINKPKNEYYLSVREVSLRSMLRRWRKATILECTKSIEHAAGKELRPVENDLISQIHLHIALGQLQNQRKAWEYLANTSGSVSLDDVLTHNMQYSLYSNMLAMKEVYKDLDPRIPYQLAVQASEISQKYRFAYYASWAMNSVLSSGAVSSDQKQLAEQVVTLADEVCREARVSKVTGNGRSYDFLKMAAASIQNNLKELGKTSPTTTSRPSNQ